jgi:hypothetical protein
MKIRSALILTVVLAGSSCIAAADTAWLLTYEAGRRAVMRAEGSSTQTAAYIGSPNIYGTTPQRLGILSKEGRGFVLRVIDKSNRQQVLSRPVNSQVLTSLSGTSQELALTADAAFFVTARFITDEGLSQGRNNLGGLYDLNRVDLDTGALTTIALPEDCAAARPVVFANSLLVYSRNSYSLWKYIPDRGRVEQLLSTNDLSALLAGEQPGSTPSAAGNQPSGNEPYKIEKALADFLPVPGRGVFHLSKSGRLQQVLTLELQPASRASPNPARNADTRVVQSFTAVFAGKPVIGLVRVDKGGRTLFSYVELAAQKILWNTTLSRRAVQGSVEPAGTSHIAYIDAEKATVTKISKSGTQSLWSLQPDPQGSFDDSRILSIE